LQFPLAFEELLVRNTLDLIVSLVVDNVLTHWLISKIGATIAVKLEGVHLSHHFPFAGVEINTRPAILVAFATFPHCLAYARIWIWWVASFEN
jgi:hypothetical protein